LNDTRYKHYLLSVLLVIMAFNLVDRQAVGIVLEDLKRDLHLTDTQLGLLNGIAFAAFYSVMGIPIARWADRGNRVAIISLTCALWSVAVALCGAAGSFIQLLAIRIGAAVGEAGCVPPAHSLIADEFSRSERSRAFARYMLGGPLSVVIGYCAAGWLNEFFGWRLTFVILGVPGLMLALLAATTLREPRAQQTAHRKPQEPGLREIATVLWANRTFMHLLIAFSLMFFFSYGVWQWVPAFFIRSHGLGTGQIGTWFAIVWGAGGLLGTYSGGELAARYAANNERLQLRAMGIAVALVGVLVSCIFIARSHDIAFAIMAIVAIGWSATYGPLFATIQAVVPQEMRAVSIAVVFLFANLIGMGLGPLAAGLISDVLSPRAGAESLRYALLSLAPGYVWAAWHLWRASRTVIEDSAAGRREP
jgi:MFS transporter, Spinster family, sphingosine-1-phosphate transporter